MPVAVVAAVREGDDRRPRAELGEPLVHRLVADERVLGAAAAVEEDQQRPLASRRRLVRHHDLDPKLAVHRLAAHGQVDDPGAMGVDRREDGGGEGEVGGGGCDQGEGKV